MVVLLIRTLIIYTVLILAMRIMGKRQIGQLEVTDLVTTFMLSEIATLPIENTDMPLINAMIPIIILLTFEVCSSAIQIRFPGLKNFFSSRPGYLIKKGRLLPSEMQKNRISADELISELRQNGITDIEEADYVIIEPDGKLSVIAKSQYKPLTPNDLNVSASDEGFSRIIISNGSINEYGLREIKRDQDWLQKKLNERGLTQKDVYLMTATESGKIHVTQKQDKADDKL